MSGSFFDRKWDSWPEVWAEVEPRLGSRAEGWRIVFNHLSRFTDPYIVETGCWRYDSEDKEDFGDGCSTWLFNKFLHFNGGSGVSIDINHQAVDLVRSKCPMFTALHSDSLHALCRLRGTALVLLLDSFDVDFNNDTLSAEHHLKELLAARHLLGRDTLIVVDDMLCVDGRMVGKGRLIDDFMRAVGNPPIFDKGYQMIYRGVF